MFRHIKYFITILVLFTCVYTVQANAATITASSCSLSDVQSAISSADSGDIVIVPSGTATWSSTLAITKSITLAGAGIGQTVITCTGGTGISYSIAGDVAFNLFGFTLIDDDKTNYGLFIYNSSTSNPIYNLKVHHNRFEGWAYGVKPHGMIYGVIYENQFYNNNYDLKPLGSSSYAWTLFPGAANIGSEHYLYIEDNTSTGADTAIMSSGEGARWVYRYNTIDNSEFNSADILWDAHGDTLNRGVVAHEIYENTVTSIGSATLQEFKTYDYRGGTGIIYNNSVQAGTSGIRTYIAVREENSSCTNPGGCDGSPCGDEVNNGYIWNNVNSRNSLLLAINESDTYGCIAEDTNWWDDSGPWGAADSPDNFAYGVAASKPGTCTDDDCYWETDTKKLYRCDGANNWTFIYAPYTYPNPLRKPLPLQNLKIQ